MAQGKEFTLLELKQLRRLIGQVLWARKHGYFSPQALFVDEWSLLERMYQVGMAAFEVDVQQEAYDLVKILFDACDVEPAPELGDYSTYFDEFRLDHQAHRLTYRGQVVDLAPKPYALLVLLSAHPGVCLEEEWLEEQVRIRSFGKALGMHIGFLRRALVSVSGKNFIQRIRSSRNFYGGYSFNPLGTAELLHPGKQKRVTPESVVA